MACVYICGPMAGHEYLNEPAFRAAGKLIRARGDTPMIPHDLPPYQHKGPCAPVYGGKKETQEHDGGCYLRGYLIKIMKKADSIYVLPGWSTSKSAKIKLAIADLLLIPVEFSPGAEL